MEQLSSQLYSLLKSPWTIPFRIVSMFGPVAHQVPATRTKTCIMPPAHPKITLRGLGKGLGEHVEICSLGELILEMVCLLL
jgi:hypothetical protein